MKKGFNRLHKEMREAKNILNMERIESEFVLKLLNSRNSDVVPDKFIELTRKKVSSKIQFSKEMIRSIDYIQIALNDLIDVYENGVKIEKKLNEEFKKLKF